MRNNDSQYMMRLMMTDLPRDLFPQGRSSLLQFLPAKNKPNVLIWNISRWHNATLLVKRADYSASSWWHASNHHSLCKLILFLPCSHLQSMKIPFQNVQRIEHFGHNLVAVHVEHSHEPYICLPRPRQFGISASILSRQQQFISLACRSLSIGPFDNTDMIV